MSVVSNRRASGELTEGQKVQLVALQRTIDRLSKGAVSIYDLQSCNAMANPMVIGALRDLGLADSEVVRPKGGSQFTAYWLTTAGAQRARQLQRAPNA